MKFLYAVLICVLSVSSFSASAQGCVAVKNMSSCSLSHDTTDQKGWQLSANYRYFRSYKHFRGRHEEQHRVEEGSEVINNDNSIILGATYTFNNRWSATAAVPLNFIDRSSLYEHYGNPTKENPTLNPRFHTQSQGFGDVRLTGYYSAVNTNNFLLSLGLGVKLPTGNFHVKDNFHKKGSQGQDSLVYKVVDQSIQLGDGGFGFSTEFNTTIRLSRSFSIYSNGLYLFNPRNTNSVLRSNSLTENIPLSNEFSVADQFLLRTGVNYNLHNLQFSLGGRYEGIASEDIIGKSNGFRRPGYIISVEPSIGFTTGNHTFGLNVPIALERNRTQNTIDKERSKKSGTYTIGDAAFADWLVSVTYAYKFSK
jgi:hypothetical protein